MYKKKQRNEGYLFKELLPYGGQIDKGNRWLKIRELIPWEELEEKYKSYFSKIGRPGKDGQLIIGLIFLGKKRGQNYFHTRKNNSDPVFLKE